jgi:antitoxin MazE
MLVRVAKWGDSLAVRIPAAHAKELGLSPNVQAELSIDPGKLVLAPLAGDAGFDLDQLIARITGSGSNSTHSKDASGAAGGRRL